MVGFLLTRGIKWRYEVYRKVEGLNLVSSGLMSILNMLYGIVKWICYVKR